MFVQSHLKQFRNMVRKKTFLEAMGLLLYFDETLNVMQILDLVILSGAC